MVIADPNRPLIRTLGRCVRNSKGYIYRALKKELPEGRPELVVLGSGWSSFHLIRQIDPSKYKVTIVSPRPHFLFTPLLTCAISGSLSLRSVMEPIRPHLVWGGRTAMKFIKAEAKDIDFEKRVVKCIDNQGKEFDIPYEKLAVGTGSATNTFGIPGVAENSIFVKELSDVKKIRSKLFENYNSVANDPKGNTSKLLNVVVVGGGPAGVEAATEIHDLMENELKKHFKETGTVTLIEMLPTVLPMFGKRVAGFATSEIRRQGIKTLTEHRVECVKDNAVHAVNTKTNEKVIIPFGQLIWASGVGPTDLNKSIIQKIQPGSRFLKARPDLSLIGADDVYGMGDCVMIEPPKLAEHADEWKEYAEKDPVGWLSRARKSLIKANFVQMHPKYWAAGHEDPKQPLKSLLEKIDAGYKPPIPTAQMARQAGSYLGTSLNRAVSRPRFIPYAPFSPSDSGAMSYVGGGQSVVSFNLFKNMPKPVNLLLLGGKGSHLLWHSYYWLNQKSFYNRMVSLSDIVKSSFSGRDMSEPLGKEEN